MLTQVVKPERKSMNTSEILMPTSEQTQGNSSKINVFFLKLYVCVCVHATCEQDRGMPCYRCGGQGTTIGKQFSHSVWVSGTEFRPLCELL